MLYLFIAGAFAYICSSKISIELELIETRKRNERCQTNEGRAANNKARRNQMKIGPVQ